MTPPNDSQQGPGEQQRGKPRHGMISGQTFKNKPVTFSPVGAGRIRRGHHPRENRHSREKPRRWSHARGGGTGFRHHGAPLAQGSHSLPDSGRVPWSDE